MFEYNHAAAASFNSYTIFYQLNECCNDMVHGLAHPYNSFTNGYIRRSPREVNDAET